MTQNDKVKIFIDEMYSKTPMRIYPTNKIIYKHTDEIWIIDLADMIEYKISNTKRYKNIFIEIDNFSKYTWCVPSKNKSAQTITNTFINI